MLLILAGITISMLTGENGLLTKAISAKDSTRGGECQEVVNLAVSENQISNYSDSNVKTKDDVVQELYNDGKLTDAEVEILKTSDTVKIGSVTVDFSGLTIEISKTPEDNENVGGGSLDDSTYIKKSAEKADSYVGYYADIDDDGTVDGIIYADLAVVNTGSGQWGDEWGNYSIPKEENINNLKDYTVSTHKYGEETTAGIYEAKGFGEKEVIVPAKNSSGTKDRFYVMALEDFSSGTYSWYAGMGKINEESDGYDELLAWCIDTGEDGLGMGKENTYTMIDIWNSEEYGEQDSYDLWGVIQEKLEKDKKEKNIVWFVPSKSEWSAFGEELGFREENDSFSYDFGLRSFYWSSSKYNSNDAYTATLDNYCIDHGDGVGHGVDMNLWVRLSATF